MAWFFTRPEVIGRAELLDRPDSAGKCSLQPVWRLLAVQGDDIEAAGQACEGWVLLEKLLGGTNQSCLFARIDAGRRAAPGGMATIAYLDEHQMVVVAHDQVQFPQAAAPVPLEQAQSLALQELTGALLGELAAVLAAQ